jgi:hypothetical protein
MKRSTRARRSSRRTHPFLKAGKNRCHSHSRNIHYSKVGGLRKKASDVSDVERWLVDRRQVAPTASQRFGLLAGRR